MFGKIFCTICDAPLADGGTFWHRAHEIGQVCCPISVWGPEQSPEGQRKAASGGERKGFRRISSGCYRLPSRWSRTFVPDEQRVICDLIRIMRR
jgi:hypothetical protein